MASWGTWLAVFSSGEGNPRGLGARPSGAVHLYRWNGERWGFAHSIWSPVTAAGPANSPGISFGLGVAFAGSSLFVSDPTQSTEGSLRGAVHRYELVEERWQWRETLTSPTNEPGRFGSAVASCGDRLFVSAGAAAPTATSLPGAVYVLERSGQGVWTIVETLRVNPTAFPPALGIGAVLVATEDEVIVSVDPAGYGVAVFGRQAGGWVQTQRIEARSNAATPNLFGFSFSSDGETLAIGDWQVRFELSPGYVDIFRRGASGWEFDQTVSSPFPLGDEFGQSVSVLGRRLVVGAPNAQELGAPFPTGRAIDYVLDDDGQWVERAELNGARLDGIDPTGRFGTVVHALGASVAVTDQIRSLDGVNPGGALLLFQVPVGERGCAPQPSSTGIPAGIDLAGPLDLLDLVPRCDVSRVPPGAVTMVYVGLPSAQERTIPGSGSAFCVRQGATAIAPAVVLADATGTASATLDLNGLVDTVLAGTPIGIQAVFRDGADLNATELVVLRPSEFR
ncbi:MAG: hypothetical protein AAGB93_21700 [Planctomycetota bacterium]